MDHLILAELMVESVASHRVEFEQKLAFTRVMRDEMTVTMNETIAALKNNEEIFDEGLLQILETVREHMLEEIDVDITYYQRKIQTVDTTVPMLRATVRALREKRGDFG